MNKNLKLFPILNKNKALPAFYLNGELDKTEKDDLINFYEFFLSNLSDSKKQKIRSLLEK